MPRESRVGSLGAHCRTVKLFVAIVAPCLIFSSARASLSARADGPAAAAAVFKDRTAELGLASANGKAC